MIIIVDEESNLLCNELSTLWLVKFEEMTHRASQTATLIYFFF